MSTNVLAQNIHCAALKMEKNVLLATYFEFFFLPVYI